MRHSFNFTRQAFQTQAWKRSETARFLRAQAHALQHQGHPEAANTKLTEAQRLDPQPED